ncbi:MAG TPA: malto-oligosyltrehalose trehalohydrolase [Polyangiaceae bacterium]
MSRAEGAPLGAWCEATGVRFAAWTDKAREVSVVLYDRPGQPSREVALGRSEEPHTFVALVREVRAGALYDFRLDGEIAVDPYARSLPFGVHGPAQVVAPLRGRVSKKRRVELDANEVIYELHVGTFTAEGTFDAARERMSELRELGITTIEMMPLAAFAGKRGWGYDGVGLFAPFSGYGSPEQLRALIDTVHSLGMSVILDVVYNHLGPDGNPLPAFSDAYFDDQRKGTWGQAPALEKPAFRRLICDNARYWLSAFGFDGLRLDATHELEPGGDPHILSELSNIAHACTPPAVLIAEDSRNDPRALLDHGIDGVWSDDFHHALHVLLTSEHDGYYGAFTGELAELAHVIERGQLFEGQIRTANEKPRGKSSAGVPQQRFVFALQNHDQVGNRASGERLNTLVGVDAFRAASLLLLFLPATPILFMGQEWACSAPFLYFSDHAGDLGHAVSRGRREEFGHFSAFREAESGAIPDPQAETSFLRSKLDWSERRSPEHARTLDLYRRALELRRTDPVLRETSRLSVGTVGDTLWVLRQGSRGERLLLFNAGRTATLEQVAGCPARDARPLLSTSHAPSTSAFELAASSAAIFSLKRTEHSREPR